MNSRPLQIAFTALTLSLVVSMSLWIVHASHKQLDISNGVTLQMPSVPAQIDRAEFQDNLRPDPFAEPFTNSGAESVSGELLPRGLETATVSKRTVNPMIIDVQDELLAQEEETKPSASDTEPLELPAIDLSEQAVAEFSPEEQAFENPVPPAEALDLKPLDAPEPPAWLSVQATLEEEIEELRNQQRQLNESLNAENREAEVFKLQNNQLDADLKASQEEIKRLQASLEGLRSETNTLKSTVSQKAEQIDELERELKESQQTRIVETPRQKSIVELDPTILSEPQQTASLPNSRPSLPLPAKSFPETTDSAVNQELKSLYGDQEPTFEEAPRQTAELPTDEIVPQLAGKTPPPLPREIASNRLQPTPKPLIPAEPQGMEETLFSESLALDSPYYESASTQPLTQTPKKRGHIYDMQDWFHNFHNSDDSCTDCEPICSDAETCTPIDCAAPIEFNEPICGCPQCTSANQWIQEDEMLSYHDSNSVDSGRGLIPQVKNWWTRHKQERNVRYEPAIVGRPANAVILPAAHAE